MAETETVLITGANRGIGLELARQYLAGGNHVIAACRAPQDAMQLDALRQTHPDSINIRKLEVTDEHSVNGLAQLHRGQPIDILINNAGVLGGDSQNARDMDFGAWTHTFAVNTMAPLRISVSLLPNLKLSRRPRVIALSSQMGSLQRRSSGYYAYRSSKAALNKVMQTLAVDLQSDRVVVCLMHPGWVKTDMGGAEADLTVEQSASGMIRVIDRLTVADSGRFLQWNGKEHPW